MGLRIASNLAAERVQSNLRKVSKETDGALQSLSSGKRINKASDDSAGLAIATTMSAQVSGLRQALRNANDGMSLVQVAEGSLNESSNLLVRMKELAVQSASDTVGETERSMINLEFQETVKEIDRISEVTIYNGVKLINGEGKDLYSFQVGANGDQSNTIEYDAGNINASSSSLGVSSLAVDDRSGALDSVEVVQEALDNLSSQRASLGAIQNRLQSAVNTIDNSMIQQEHARSIIEDVDVAESASKLVASSISKNAAIAALAQANTIPKSAISLI
jgi:flagellin